MSASHNEAPDELESGSAAAEESEIRMRESLNRLSGDRSVSDRPSSDRHGGDRPQSERMGGDRSGGDRFGGSRSPPQPSGSFSSAGPRRHRYVQDGEVPVVQISSLRDRRRDPVSGQPAQEAPSDHMRALLSQERAARLRAEQLLERAQAAVHGLETRLGHAEITQHEAVEQSRAHEAEVARVHAEMAELTAQLKVARAETAAAMQRHHEVEAELAQERVKVVVEPIFAAEPPPLFARSGKTPGRRPRIAKAETVMVAPPPAAFVEADEPEPVKWWLTPAPKSKTKARRAS